MAATPALIMAATRDKNRYLLTFPYLNSLYHGCYSCLKLGCYAGQDQPHADFPCLNRLDHGCCMGQGSLLRGHRSLSFIDEISNDFYATMPSR